MSEPDRSSESLVFVSTGRRLAAAKVGRRWHEVRGPLMIGAALASAQALLLFVVLRMLQDQGLSLRWFVPIVALTTLALVAWLGLVRAAFGRVVPLGQAPAAAILETIEAVRGPLRGGFDAASAQVLAYETRERLGYAAVSVCDRESVLAHAGLGADHHGAGLPAPPGRRRRHDRAPRLAAAGRLEARLRRPRLPAALGDRRADREPQRGGRRDRAVQRDGARGLRSRPRHRAPPRRARLDRGHARRARPARARDGLGRARRDAGDDRAALPLQRAQHDRGVLPHAARRGAPARALVRRALPAQPAAPARVRAAARRAAPRRGLRRARARALRRPARGRSCARRRPPSWRSCHRCSCNHSSRTPSTTARPTGRCASSCAATCASAGCASPCATTGAASRASSPTACSSRASARAPPDSAWPRPRSGWRSSTASTAACASRRRPASVRSSRS